MAENAVGMLEKYHESRKEFELFLLNYRNFSGANFSTKILSSALYYYKKRKSAVTKY